MNLLPARAASTLVDRVHHVDLFTLCDWLYEAGITVDMILCDLPYGTTACAWDEVIPFEPMWRRFKRVIKPKGAIVLTASQPFTSRLVCSNLDMFRYEWVWEKTMAANFMNVAIQPQKKHENVLVFGLTSPNYYPQMQAGKPYVDKRNRADKKVGVLDTRTSQRKPIVNTGERYPDSVILFSNGNNNVIHPTQKPTALFEYLIRTYTRPGELVLDPCVGSGTTAEAARNTGRRYVVGDAHWKYAQVARDRMAAPYTLPMFADAA